MCHITPSKLTGLCHTIQEAWSFSPSKYDTGIMHNLTFSCQSLWGLCVICEVMQVSLPVRYQSFGRPVASGHTLEMKAASSSKHWHLATKLYGITFQNTVPFEIMFFQNIRKQYFRRLLQYLNYFSCASILKKPQCGPLEEMTKPVPHLKFPTADVYNVGSS